MELVFDERYCDGFLLRNLEVEDVSDMYAYLSDEQTLRYLRFPHDMSIDELLVILQEEYLPYTKLAVSSCWCLEALDSGQVVGHVRLYDVTMSSAHVEAVLHRAWWGRGWMKQVLTRLIETAFTMWGLQELYADIDACNQRSERLFRQLGFSEAVPSADTLADPAILQLRLSHRKGRS